MFRHAQYGFLNLKYNKRQECIPIKIVITYRQDSLHKIFIINFTQHLVSLWTNRIDIN